MSEFRNYIVMLDCPAEKATSALRAELVERRKWQEVASETPGAKLIQVWSAKPDMTVVELISEIESDAPLGKALSRDCDTSVAVHYYESVSGVAELHVFERGKKAAVRKSRFADMAGRGAWDQLKPEGPVQTLSFRDGKSETIAEVMALVRECFEPALHELSMNPTTIRADHPAIRFAVGYALAVGDGTSVVVRYTAPTDGPVTIKQDIWHERLAGKEYTPIWSGAETQLVRDCDSKLYLALLKRECHLLAARLVREGASKIEEAVPGLSPALEVARRSEAWRRIGATLEDLERRRNVARDTGSGWTPVVVVFKGGHLLVVQSETNQCRFTFRFDTGGLPDSGDVAVGALWESWAGTASARKLRVGGVVLDFDYDGKYLGRSGG